MRPYVRNINHENHRGRTKVPKGSKERRGTRSSVRQIAKREINNQIEF